MRLVIFARSLYYFKSEVFERVVDGNYVGIALDVDHALDPAFGNNSFADAARMGGHVERCAGQFDAFFYGLGKKPLFRTDSIANFSPLAGGDLLNVADAANDVALVALVEAVIARLQNFTVPDGKSADLSAETGGLRANLL